MSGRVDRGGLVVVAAADVDVAAPVREKDVEEEEDAASPGAADLHGNSCPENEQIGLFQNVLYVGILAGNQNSGYRSRCFVPLEYWPLERARQCRTRKRPKPVLKEQL